LSKVCHLFTPILKEITRYRIVAKALLLKEAMLLFRFLLEFTPYFDTEQE